MSSFFKFENAVLIFFIAIVSCTIFGLFSSTVSFLFTLPATYSAVVIDAGSTGTRAYVFRFSYENDEFGHKKIRFLSKLSCNEEEGGSPDCIEQETNHQSLSSNVNLSASLQSSRVKTLFETKKIYPGIIDIKFESLFAYLKELKNFVFNELNEEEKFSTFLFFRGTAGMRSLSFKDKKKLKDMVYNELKSWKLRIDESNGVEIIDGETEGLFAWLCAKALSEKEKEKIGLIEVGGGSAQIVLEKTHLEDKVDFSDLSDETKIETEVYGKALQFYVKSYQGLGREYALKHHLERLAMEYKDDDIIFSPCLQKGVNFSFSDAKLFQKAQENLYADWDQRIVRGSSDYNSCSKRISEDLEALKVNKTPFFVPKDIQLIATENYFFFNEYVANSGGSYLMNAAKFRKEATVLCPLSYEEVKSKINIEAADEKAQTACFGLIYLATLLVEVFKVDENHPIHALQQIEGVDIAWPLGFVISELPKFLDSKFHNELSFNDKLVMQYRHIWKNISNLFSNNSWIIGTPSSEF